MWEPPFLEPESCLLTCLDPEIEPEGYTKSSGTWRCADGYAGTVALKCMLNETEIFNRSCSSELRLEQILGFVRV